MTDLDKLLQMASSDIVSDELLAAYIDGNTTAEENTFIESSTPLEDLNDIAELSQDSLSFEEQLHFYDGDYGYWELGIPPVLGNNDINDYTNMNERVNYGYEPNYELEKFDPNIFQEYVNTCAIRAQEIILRDYGIMLSQDNLIDYATSEGWFEPNPETGGTPKEAMGNILEACNVGITRTENATIYDIIAELRAGHRVMVSLDADELWVKNEPDLFRRMTGEVKNHINDKFQNFLGIEGANHALVVAGVNINPNNPADIKVVLIDSGTGEVCVEYDYKNFHDAWSDRHCLMISTNEPAPYQYNYQTHEMEPSGFSTAFIPSTNELPSELTNNFHLAHNYYDHYEQYEPVYGDTDDLLLWKDIIMDIPTEVDNSDILSDDITFNTQDVVNLQIENEIQEPTETILFEDSNTSEEQVAPIDIFNSNDTEQNTTDSLTPNNIE